MAFELLISFHSPDLAAKVRTKQRVTDWLDAVGRSDFVDGIIDGIETSLTVEEEATGLTSDERFDASPLALFDDFQRACAELADGLLSEFGGDIRCAINEITDDSWQQCWREDFTPLSTKNFYIAPLGDSTPTPQGLRRVEIDARGHAFGTGQHATTRAMIEVLEAYFQAWGVKSVLDVGTGTGIYLILAHLLGAETLAATEISEDLVGVARGNCEASGIAADIRLRDKPDFSINFDLVIANILAPVLHDLMGYLVQHLKSGGRLMLAGFVDKEEPGIVRKASEFGLEVEIVRNELGWKCVVMRRPS